MPPSQSADRLRGVQAAGLPVACLSAQACALVALYHGLVSLAAG